jgi:hypothetical protein
MRLHQARQGRAPRLQRAGRAAVCVISAGIGACIAYSRLFYPHPLSSPKPEPPLRVTMRLERIRDTALGADLCRRILRAQAMTAAAHSRKESQ